MIRLINLSYPEKLWSLDTLVDILTKVKEYADAHQYRDVSVTLIEDQTYSDPANNRFNVEIIATTPEGRMIHQMLFYLKGEIIDGNDFHRRHDEFYGDRRHTE